MRMEASSRIPCLKCEISHFSHLKFKNKKVHFFLLKWYMARWEEDSGWRGHMNAAAAAAAAKSLQSCPTLCDPIDSSPPGSPIPGILQARTLEWVAISFSIVPATFALLGKTSEMVNAVGKGGSRGSFHVCICSCLHSAYIYSISIMCQVLLDKGYTKVKKSPSL